LPLPGTIGEIARTDTLAQAAFLHPAHDRNGQLHFIGTDARTGRNRIEPRLQRLERIDEILRRQGKRRVVEHVGHLPSVSPVFAIGLAILGQKRREGRVGTVLGDHFEEGS
jgi:hypothetical protein